MNYTVRQHMPPVRSGRRRSMTSPAAGVACVPAARLGLPSFITSGKICSVRRWPLNSTLLYRSTNLWSLIFKVILFVTIVFQMQYSQSALAGEVSNCSDGNFFAEWAEVADVTDIVGKNLFDIAELEPSADASPPPSLSSSVKQILAVAYGDALTMWTKRFLNKIDGDKIPFEVQKYTPHAQTGVSLYEHKNITILTVNSTDKIFTNACGMERSYLPGCDGLGCEEYSPNPPSGSKQTKLRHFEKICKEDVSTIDAFRAVNKYSPRLLFQFKMQMTLNDNAQLLRFDCFIPRRSFGVFQAKLVQLCVSGFLTLASNNNSLASNNNSFKTELEAAKATLIPELKKERDLCIR